MKKSILILVFFAVTNLFGQEAKKFDYQVDFGTTFSIPYKKTVEVMQNFEGHPITNYSSNFGGFCELFVSYCLNSKFAINSGLNFNYNRLKINDLRGIFVKKGYLSTSYLSLPILINYQISNEIPLSFSVGTSLSLLLNTTEKGTVSVDTSKVISEYPEPGLIDIHQDYNHNITKGYATFDIAITSQVGYQLKINEKFNGVIFTRFNYGLKDVIEKYLATASSATYWKNYNLMIGFGIKF